MKKVSSPFDNKENNKSCSAQISRKLHSTDNEPSAFDRVESLHFQCQVTQDQLQQIMSKTQELIHKSVLI